MLAETRACQACGAVALREIVGFAALPRVTSDCSPFREGGRLAVCHECGVAQAIPDDQWLAETREIYAKYDIYRQSGGHEQHVCDSASGGMRARSEVLLDRLQACPETPLSGKLLDVGCGTGVTLNAFAKRGNWELHGLDIHDRNLALLSEIKGFQELHIGTPADLTESFDVITLIHALEHIPEPRSVLRQLQRNLRNPGILFIQVPNAAANPFDYVIADHLLHFTPYALQLLVRQAGFHPIHISTDWITKEISLVAQSGGAPSAGSPGNGGLPPVVDQVSWLESLSQAAEAVAASSACFGLFGSSIAATWVWSKVSRHVQFFVDEDPTRAGRKHLGLGILRPDQVPPGASVFIPLPNALAVAIRNRLGSLPFHLHLPPSL